MKVSINQKVYQIEDTDSPLFLLDFLIKENILLISDIEFLKTFDDIKVEMESCADLVNAKDVILEDGQVIYTLSDKIVAYYNALWVSNFFSIDKIELDESNYHILICEPHIYQECFSAYQDKGFQDIINLKFAEMIYYLEVSHQLLLDKSKKLDLIRQDPIWIVKHNLLHYPANRVLNIKSPEEIAAILIKEYYQRIRHIEKPIHITYITTSSLSYHTVRSQILCTNSMIDQVVLMNQFEVIGSGVCYDGGISKEIYIKDTVEIDTPYNAMIVFQLFEQMGFKTESFETSINDDILWICARYKEVTFDACVCPKFLSIEQLDALTDVDFIFIADTFPHLQYQKMTAFLEDYNMNHIYKKFLLYPGYSTICRR
ncbi:MAG: hypothetical protein NC182_07700 [Prevotella sp.]|nr:hypothetical protein [Staphylococcus sp.]MCM1351068.1 hypothetical protein [Prevotella sp.]